LPGAVLLALLFASGCERSASSQSIGTADNSASMEEASEEDLQFSLPSSYLKAVARLHECRDAISDAISSGDFEKAHHPLDETDWLLNWLPELARASGVPRRDWEQVVVAGDDLGESLGEIHADIDAGHTPDFASRAATIEYALTRLQDVSGEVVTCGNT